MPHCIIEHSSSLSSTVDFPDLMNTIFNIIESTKLFSPEAIKVRCLPFDLTRIEGNCSTFIHVTIKILDGREKNAKKQITSTLF